MRASLPHCTGSWPAICRVTQHACRNILTASRGREKEKEETRGYATLCMDHCQDQAQLEARRAHTQSSCLCIRVGPRELGLSAGSASQRSRHHLGPHRLADALLALIT
ncbi:hypothetical protein MHYP_G00193620 [Metynnis hypsauchen]